VKVFFLFPLFSKEGLGEIWSINVVLDDIQQVASMKRRGIERVCAL